MRIIDELFDEPKTLTNCALVSRLWLSCARKTLYHTIKLDSELRAHHLCSLVFTNAEIARCVRVLKFNVYSFYMYQGRYPPNGLQSWVPPAAAVLSSRLHDVSTIHFEYIQWHMLRGFDQDFLKALSKYTSVRTVRFWACAFENFADFEGILLAFPAVRRLQLDSVSWDQPLAKPPYSLRLDSLSTSSRFSLPLLRRWLDKIQAHTTLRELELDPLCEEEDLRAAGEILAKMDTALQGLTICCRFSCNGYGRLQDVDRWLRIERNTALRTLQIRIHDLIPEYMHWVTNLLRAVEAPSLTTLIFNVCLFMPNQMFGEVWDDVAWLLSETPRYAGLQRVRFVHRGPLSMDLASAALCQQFPLLRSRGVLEVEGQQNLAIYK